MSQMRCDDAATENCRLQCNVNETEMSSTVSENRTVTLTCQSCISIVILVLLLSSIEDTVLTGRSVDVRLRVCGADVVMTVGSR